MSGSCITKDGRIISTSDNFAQYVAIEKSELIGKSISDFLKKNEMGRDFLCRNAYEIPILVEIDRYDGLEFISIEEADTLSYETLSELGQVAVLERRWGEFFRYLDNLGTKVDDMHKYLVENPDELDKLHGFIEIVRLNKATIKLYGGNSEQEVIEFMTKSRIMNDEDYATGTINIWQNPRKFEGFVVSKITDMNGNQKVIMDQAHYYRPLTDTIVETFLDITDITQLQNQLLEEETKFKLLFEEIPMSVTMFHDRKLVDCNQHFINEYGYESRKEVIGSNIDRFIAPDQREMINRNYEQRIETGVTPIQEYLSKSIRKDGSTFVTQMNVSLLTFGGKTYSIGIGQDVTNKIESQYQQELLQKQILETHRLESLGLLSGGIAHDFNNLLMVIAGGIDLFREMGTFDDDSQELLTDLLATTEKAASLTKQLLMYSGKSIQKPVLFDPANLIEESRSIYQLAIPKNIEVNFDLEQGSMIEGDQTQFSQIVMNLLINASEAIGTEAGLVTIGVEKVLLPIHLGEGVVFNANPIVDGQYVKISVKDTGGGINEENIQFIFDPFFTTKETGTGLGLSVVQGIVYRQGGVITINSPPEAGTIFSIFLPLIDGYSTMMHDEKLGGYNLEPGTVMLVDDEVAVVMILKRMLERLGFSVITAENGKVALDKYMLDSENIDLIVLDLSMPLMSGRKTLESLMKLNPDLPVLISSGYSPEKTSDLFKKKNIRYLQKPYLVSELEKELHLLLN